MAARVTDKMLDNYLHLGLLATLFLLARMIHCRRDRRDVCLSCFFQYFNGLNFTWDLNDLGQHYRNYERLIAHWRVVLPLPILDVAYEDLVAVCFFIVSLAGSIGYLAYRHNRPEWAQIADAWAVSGAEVAVIYCTIVLTTGPIWGRRAWGIWWTWDARLTTTLVLWLIYVSYLLLRRFAAGPQMQTLAAVLGIFGALDVPIVYMSNRWWRTQHPAPVFGGGPDSGIKDPRMLAAWGWNLLAWMAWGLLILALRYHVEREHQRIAARRRRLH